MSIDNCEIYLASRLTGNTKKKEVHKMDCCEDMPKWYWALKRVILGVLILLNVFVWPQWLGVDGWIAFVGVLMILFGLVHLVFPCCKKKGKK